MALSGLEGKFCWENLRERGHLEYLSVDGRVILKWILRNSVRVWTGLIGIWIGTGVNALMNLGIL